MSTALERLIKKLTEYGNDEGLRLLLKAISDEDLEGMSMVDDPNLEDEDVAAEWLKQQESKPKKASRSRDWKPSEDITEEELAAIQEHIDSGHSEREAHRLAGTHKEHGDLQQAMRSGLNPSMMSGKMLEMLKPLAKEWVDNADRHSMLTADVNKNPVKYAAGQTLAAHEDHTKDYDKAYHDFLNSDDVKNLSGFDRHKAIREWKKGYKEENPDFDKGYSEVADKSSSTHGEARTVSKQNLEDKMAHIMSGGASLPGVSVGEAAQHLGQEGTGDAPPSVGTEDITSSFTAKNPKLMETLNQDHMAEHKERLNRIDSHASAKGVIRRRKGTGDAD